MEIAIQLMSSNNPHSDKPVVISITEKMHHFNPTICNSLEQNSETFQFYLSMLMSDDTQLFIAFANKTSSSSLDNVSHCCKKFSLGCTIIDLP